MTQKHNLRIGHLNVYHLYNKLLDINAFIRSEHVDILGISESRLNSNICDNAVGIPGFFVVRRDAVECGETGLAVYVNQTLQNSVRRRLDLETSCIECVWLELHNCAKNTLLLGIIYRNPASSLCWYDDFVNMMDNVNASGKNVLLLGDFNIDLFKRNNAWSSTTALFGLVQLVPSATRVTSSTSTLIDHVYTTDVHLVHRTWVPEIGISDHFPILCSVQSKIKCKKREHTYMSYRSFKNFNPKTFCYDLQQSPFHEVLNYTNPNYSLQHWYSLFLKVLNKHAPVRKKTCASSTVTTLVDKRSDRSNVN